MNSSSNIEKIASQIEALLFIFGESLDKKKISSTLKVTEEEIEKAADFLKEQYSDPKRGIVLMENAGKYMLATKPEHSVLVEKFVTEDLKEELTPAALETLSIISYFGPVTRAQIDFLRGVNSSFILRSLLIRGLIERKTAKGLAFEYEVSFEFLKYMGIDHVSKMPKYEEYQKLKDQYFSEKIEEAKPAESPAEIPVGESIPGPVSDTNS
jgi:segregation and condensation protein B